MKRLMVALAIVLLIPALPVVEADSSNDSSIDITEPSGGIYIQGDRILPSFTPFWTAFIGTSSIDVETKASSNILTVYFTLYDVQAKETVDKRLDVTAGDGFSCTFSNVPRGIYLVAAVALAADIEEPVTSDWHTPIFVLPI